MKVPPGWLEQLQPYYVLSERQVVNLGGVSITLDPESLGRSYIERAEVVVLQIIRDQLGQRPIYFSRTVGLTADQFGLTGHLEGHGFARKLYADPVPLSDSVVAVAATGRLNLARTTALAFGVYHGETAARQRPRGWVDHPSEGILTLYGITYQGLAEAVASRDPALAQRAALLADSIFANTSVAQAVAAQRR